MCTLGRRSISVQSFFTAVQPQFFGLLETILELSHMTRWSPAFLLDKIAPSAQRTSESNHAIAAELEMWQLQNEIGFLQLTYDPSTGERIHVVINDLHAQMLGMHRDELLARFAAHDEPLRVPAQDLLLLIADDALRGFADGPRHYRTFLSDACVPSLVCVSTLRSHDATGRLLSVRLRLRIPPPSLSRSVH